MTQNERNPEPPFTERTDRREDSKKQPLRQQPEPPGQVKKDLEKAIEQHGPPSRSDDPDIDKNLEPNR